MCSATQCGLRVRLSKEDVNDGAGRRSLIGPGKPYWKTPEGSTGEMRAGIGLGIGAGIGAGGPVVVEVTVVVEVVVGGIAGAVLRDEKKAAVQAAPVAAPAMTATVILDMLRLVSSRVGDDKW